MADAEAKSGWPRQALAALAVLACLAVAATGCRPSPAPQKPKAGKRPNATAPVTTGPAVSQDEPQGPFQAVQEVIQRTVSNQSDPEVASWADEGGPANLSVLGPVLVVSQSPAGLKKVGDLLRALEKKGALKVERADETEATQDEGKSVETLRFLLAEKIDLDFEKTPLPQALKYIQKLKPGLNIVISPELANNGVDVSTLTVTVKVKQMAVSDALKEVLSPNFVYRVQPGHVLVTGPEYSTPLRTATYRLRETQPGASRYPPQQLEWDDLKSVLCRTVNNMGCIAVAAWADEGGPAALEYYHGAMIVSQTDEGHRRVAALLDKLTRMGALQSDAGEQVAGPEETPETAKLRAQLREPMDLKVEKTGLDNALVLISRHGPQINIDPEIASAAVDLSAPVLDLDLKQVPVAAILDLILAPNLGYKVGPYGILVMHRDKLQQDLPIVVYKVVPVGAARQAPADTGGEN